MQSIFKLNRARRAKLRILLKSLFTEYEYIHINSAGIITFKHKWYSIKRYQNTLVELCLTLIPKALSNYRQADASYIFVIKDHIEYAISSKSSHIVDFLYDEFQKKIKVSKIDDLLEASCYCLAAADESNTTIDLIVPNQPFSSPTYNVGMRVKETLTLMANTSRKASKQANKKQSYWLQ